MLIRNLQYLAALAHERHFARAAAACDVTQPTLSSGIKQLEEELGLLIVQRGRRFEGFTPEGNRVLEWARRILSDFESLQQEASELRAGLVGRLRLGVIPTTLPMVSTVTSPFALRHPQVVITVLSLSSIEIQRGLDDFSLDAGLTYLENEPLANVRAVPLYQESYFLFTPMGSPLANRREISWREAASVPLCLLTPDMQNRRIVNRHFHEAGIDIRPHIEANSIVALCSHLRSGHWSSVLPQTFLQLFGEAFGSHAIPLVHPQASHQVGLVVPDREPLTPSARELLALLSDPDVAAGIAGATPLAGHIHEG
jgi:DNA-binding transcriptional LysR family regulator